MIEIEAPDGTIVEFPAGTTDDVIKAAMARTYPPSFGGEEDTPQAAPQIEQAQATQPRQPIDVNQGVSLGDRALVGAGKFLQPVATGIVGAAQGVTAGHIDEGAALVAATAAAKQALSTGQNPIDAFKLTFEGQLNETRQAFGQLKEDNPVVAGASNLGGAVLGVGKAAKALPTLTKLVPSALKGAKGLVARTGAAAGDAAAVSAAFASGEGRDIGEAALEGAAFGAAANPLVSGLLKGAAAIAPKIKIPVPSFEQLTAAAKRAYQRVDDLGVSYTRSRVQPLVKSVNSIATGEGLGRITPKSHPITVEAIKRLNTEIGSDGVKLTDLNTFRSFLRGAAPGSDDARLAGEIATKIDKFISVANPVSRGKVGPQRVKDAVSKAKGLWRRSRNIERLEDGIERAALNKDQNSMRQSLKSILLKKTERRFFNAEELALISKAVKGTKTQNITRGIGKTLAPTSALNLGVGAGTGAAVGATVGGPVGAAVGAGTMLAIGQTARSASDAIARKNLDKVIRLVATGSLRSVKQGKSARFLARQETREKALASLIALRESLINEEGNEDENQQN